MGSSLRTTWPQGLLLFNCKQNPTHECWDEGLSGHEIIPCVLHEEFWSLQLFLFCKLQWVQDTGFQNFLSFVSWIFDVTLQPSAKICDQREDEETRIPQPFFLKFLSGTCYSVKRLLLVCLSLGGAVKFCQCFLDLLFSFELLLEILLGLASRLWAGRGHGDFTVGLEGKKAAGTDRSRIHDTSFMCPTPSQNFIDLHGAPRVAVALGSQRGMGLTAVKSMESKNSN